MKNLKMNYDVYCSKEREERDRARAFKFTGNFYDDLAEKLRQKVKKHVGAF